MTGNTSFRKTGALALVAMLIMSILATGLAAAAVSSVSVGNTSYSVDEDRVTDVTVDVTADSNGISNETLTLDVTDDTGTVVHTYSKTIDVAANSTDTFAFTVDPASDSLDPGSYTLDATAGTQSSGTSDLTVNDVQEPSTAWGQSNYDLFVDGGDSIAVEYTLNAGDRSQTSNVTVTVTDPSSNETYKKVIQDVSVGAGNSTTGQVTIDSADVDVTGDHQVHVVWAGAGTTSTLSVTDPASPAVNLNDLDYEMYNSSDAVSVSTTLAAGDYDQTSNATLTITDSSGNVVYDAEQTDVTVAAGSTETITFDVVSEDIDATGNYTAEIAWESDSASTGFDVIEGEGDAVFAGGVSGGAGATGIIVLIGALISIALGVAAFRGR